MGEGTATTCRGGPKQATGLVQSTQQHLYNLVATEKSLLLPHDLEAPHVYRMSRRPFRIRLRKYLMGV
jgi:hypothetical protein